MDEENLNELRKYIQESIDGINKLQNLFGNSVGFILQKSKDLNKLSGSVKSHWEKIFRVFSENKHAFGVLGFNTRELENLLNSISGKIGSKIFQFTSQDIQSLSSSVRSLKGKYEIEKLFTSLADDLQGLNKIVNNFSFRMRKKKDILDKIQKNDIDRSLFPGLPEEIDIKKAPLEQILPYRFNILDLKAEKIVDLLKSINRNIEALANEMNDFYKYQSSAGNTIVDFFKGAGWFSKVTIGGGEPRDFYRMFFEKVKDWKSFEKLSMFESFKKVVNEFEKSVRDYDKINNYQRKVIIEQLQQLSGGKGLFGIKGIDKIAEKGFIASMSESVEDYRNLYNDLVKSIAADKDLKSEFLSRTNNMKLLVDYLDSANKDAFAAITNLPDNFKKVFKKYSDSLQNMSLKYNKLFQPVFSDIEKTLIRTTGFLGSGVGKGALTRGDIWFETLRRMFFKSFLVVPKDFETAFSDELKFQAKELRRQLFKVISEALPELSKKDILKIVRTHVNTFKREQQRIKDEVERANSISASIDRVLGYFFSGVLGVNIRKLTENFTDMTKVSFNYLWENLNKLGNSMTISNRKLKDFKLDFSKGYDPTLKTATIGKPTEADFQAAYKRFIDDLNKNTKDVILVNGLIAGLIYKYLTLYKNVFTIQNIQKQILGKITVLRTFSFFQNLLPKLQTIGMFFKNLGSVYGNLFLSLYDPSKISVYFKNIKTASSNMAFDIAKGVVSIYRNVIIGGFRFIGTKSKDLINDLIGEIIYNYRIRRGSKGPIFSSILAFFITFLPKIYKLFSFTFSLIGKIGKGIIKIGKGIGKGLVKFPQLFSPKNFIGLLKKSIPVIKAVSLAMIALAVAAGAAYAGIYFGLIKPLIESAKVAEQRFVRLASALQDSGKAVKEYTKAIEFSARTPFLTSQVADAAAMLRSFQFDPFEKVGKSGRTLMELLGDMAGAMGTDLETATWALIRAQVGEWEIMQNNFQISARMIPQLQGLASGTKEYGKAILEYLDKQQRFVGGLFKMSQSIQGMQSNIKDFFGVIMEYAHGVVDSQSLLRGVTFVDTYKDMLRGSYVRVTSRDFVSVLGDIETMNQSTEETIRRLGTSYEREYKKMIFQTLNLYGVLKGVYKENEILPSMDKFKDTLKRLSEEMKNLSKSEQEMYFLEKGIPQLREALKEGLEKQGVGGFDKVTAQGKEFNKALYQTLIFGNDLTKTMGRLFGLLSSVVLTLFYPIQRFFESIIDSIKKMTIDLLDFIVPMEKIMNIPLESQDDINKAFNDIALEAIYNTGRYFNVSDKYLEGLKSRYESMGVNFSKMLKANQDLSIALEDLGDKGANRILRATTLLERWILVFAILIEFVKLYIKDLFDDFWKNTEEIRSAIWTVFSTVFKFIWNTLYSLIEGLVEGIVGIYKWIVDFFASFGVDASITGLFKDWKDFFLALYDALEPLFPLIKLIGQILGGALALLLGYFLISFKIFYKVLTFLAKLLKILIITLVLLVKAIVWVIKAIVWVIKLVLKILDWALGGLVGFFAYIGELIFKGLSRLANLFGFEELGKDFDNLSKSMKNFKEFLWKNFSQGKGFFEIFWEIIAEKIGSGVGSFWEGIKDFFARSWEDIIKAVKKAFYNFIAFINSLIPDFLKHFRIEYLTEKEKKIANQNIEFLKKALDAYNKNNKNKDKILLIEKEGGIILKLGNNDLSEFSIFSHNLLNLNELYEELSSYMKMKKDFNVDNQPLETYNENYRITDSEKIIEEFLKFLEKHVQPQNKPNAFYFNNNEMPDMGFKKEFASYQLKNYPGYNLYSNNGVQLLTPFTGGIGSLKSNVYVGKIEVNLNGDFSGIDENKAKDLGAIIGNKVKEEIEKQYQIFSNSLKIAFT